MDITEIIERLKNIAEHAIHTTGEEPFVMGLDDGIAVHEAIELLEKAETNCPEFPDSWIPVSERLPQSDPEDLEYPTVIICSPNGSVELGCFYESTKEWGAGENFDRLRNPVAWMPLPEPWEGE